MPPPGDMNGVEALQGESEAEYVARQTRLREEAAARMRAKFGGSGGLNGRLGGVGSNGCGGCGSSSYGSTPSEGYLGSAYNALPDSQTVKSSVGSGLGTAASVVGSTSSWLFGKVAETTSAVASRYANTPGSPSRGGGGGDDEPSTDISDLLSGGLSYQRDAPADAPPAAATQDKDAWNDTAQERDPSDLSDLLSSASLDPPPPRAQRSGGGGVPAPALTGDDFFGDSSWGSGGGQDFGSDGKHVAPVANVRPAGAGTLASRTKKVAAKKDKSWDDDWGDAW